MATTVRYLARCVRCHLSEAELGAIKSRVDQLPDAVGAGRLNLTNLDIVLLKDTRRRWWRLKVPPFRIFFLPAGDEIIVAEVDRRDDHTYDDLRRLDRILLVRNGDGLRVVRADPPPEAAVTSYVRPAGKERIAAVRRDQQNPLTPFGDRELAALGASAETISLVRTLGEGVDLAEELAARGVDPHAIELLAGAWTSPSGALKAFADGRTPADELLIGEAELAARAGRADSATSLATLDDAAFAAILAGSVEEWMFYLHPSQTRIVEAPATGPLRVRGGPGTGKSVAALHRARWLARSGAERVLVTTFVSVLPKVWSQLFAGFAADVRNRIEALTVDAVAFRLVRDARGVTAVVQTSERKRLLERALADVPAARSALGGGTFAFEQEIDFVIAGRTLDAASYLIAPRTGRGRALAPPQRAHVWEAYDRYRQLLDRDGRTDWAHLRADALRLAEAGAGPRYDAIVVDEAQDLTEAHLRLLLAIDADPDHRGFMLVGDGQQAIYPGGFSLRSVGVEVRGRSYLLRANWRNTQLIAMAAEAVIGDVEFIDLDGDAPRGTRATAEAPLPLRLGEPAVLHVVPAGDDHDVVLAAVVDDLLSRHAPGDLAILTGTNAEAEHARAALAPRPGIDLRRFDGVPVDAIRIGTYHRSKGLEFKAVVILGATRRAFQRASWGLTAPADLEEAEATWARTLFVAMTRARDELVLIASEPLAPQVDRARKDFDVEVW